MKPGRIGRLFGAAAFLCIAGYVVAEDQSALQPVIDDYGRALTFDWPAIHIGSASYEEGPTGVTVFHFPERAYVAVDIRGGAPGTVNAPYIELGHNIRELDTVVFAGGSWYGLEAATAVASALKDDGIRDGNAFGAEPNIAMSIGSIIFDFGSRRLNEIYPDKKLAQAAYRTAVPGRFPLGAAGAGRNAMTGYFFGCNAQSGQGGAFLQRGNLKIAAFAVVNSFGVVTDRDGRVAACYRRPEWPPDLKSSDLLKHFPESRESNWATSSSKNTTISLVVVNQRMSAVELKRLAVQVHMSMGRALQPYSTIADGDVLYAVSTAELNEPEMFSADVGALASELMWTAILASVPDQIEPIEPSDRVTHSSEYLNSLVGDYVFSEFATLRVTRKGRHLLGRAIGTNNVYSIGKDDDVALMPATETDFVVPGRYPMSLMFVEPGQVTVNPGRWEQIGIRK